jgi:RNA polymerase sigma factor (sigma-70 family)
VSAHASNSTDGGDQGQFAELVELHYGALFRFAMSLAGNESAAADLVQETFLIWAEKGGQLRDPAKAKSWLFTTLNRQFLQSRRRIVRFPEVGLEDAEAELPVVEARLVERLDGMRLLELLAQVDPLYQAAVSLFYLEDYSYPEIAEILDVPLGTVKSRIARGVGQLKGLVLGNAGKGGGR